MGEKVTRKGWLRVRVKLALFDCMGSLSRTLTPFPVGEGALDFY